jgi:hypothetical protein
MLLVLLPLLVVPVLSSDAAAASKPHVLIMIADDLGYNDISAHGSAQIPTPAIDGLMKNGARLDQYYVQPVCSPTRATLLTGRHVIHTGVYDPVLSGSRGDLSLNFTMLPQRLAALGFSCHMVGKWHLGDSSWRFTPLARGFETYTGYLSGAEDYWKHGDADSDKTANSLDFWSGTAPDYSESCIEPYYSRGGEQPHYKSYDRNGETGPSFGGKPWQPLNGNSCPIERYSAHVFARRAATVIEAVAAAQKPLFLYLAWQVNGRRAHPPVSSCEVCTEVQPACLTVPVRIAWIVVGRACIRPTRRRSRTSTASRRRSVTNTAALSPQWSKPWTRALPT